MTSKASLFVLGLLAWASFLIAYELDNSVDINEELTLFSSLSKEELLHMQNAAHKIKNWYYLLDRTQSSLHDELLRGEGEYQKGTRYPQKGIYDKLTGSKYFYHSHREKEHGHFHLFVYEDKFPIPIKPLAYPDKRHVAHLIAISMDNNGFPKSLFTINEWVTDEAWYSAEDTITLLPHFEISHTKPSYPLNQWITQMLVLFRPQIEALLKERDQKIKVWQQEHKNEDVFRAKELEVINQVPISVEKQAFAIDCALKGLD